MSFNGVLPNQFHLEEHLSPYTNYQGSAPPMDFHPLGIKTIELVHILLASLILLTMGLMCALLRDWFATTPLRDLLSRKRRPKHNIPDATEDEEEEQPLVVDECPKCRPQQSPQPESNDYFTKCKLPKEQVILWRTCCKSDDPAKPPLTTHVGQAFFIAKDTLLTTAHSIKPGEKYVISKSQIGRAFPVLSVQYPTGPAKDVIYLKVENRAFTQLEASVAKIASEYLPGDTVSVCGGGLEPQESSDRALQSIGNLEPWEGAAGILISAHNCNTLKGFSGAPIFCGNKVVAMHNQTQTDMFNIATNLWPVLGTKCQISPQFESSEMDANFFRHDDTRILEYDDMVYVSKAGRFYNIDRQVYQKLKQKMPNTTDSLYVPPKENAWADGGEEIDFNSPLVFESSNALPTPLTPLNVDAVRQANVAITQVNNAYFALRTMAMTTSRLLNLALSQKDEEGAKSLANNFTYLSKQLAPESFKQTIRDAIDNFSYATMLSEQDEKLAKKWKKRRDAGDPDAEFKQITDGYIAEIDTYSKALAGIPKRLNKNDLKIQVPPEPEFNDRENAFFLKYGINFANPEEILKAPAIELPKKPEESEPKVILAPQRPTQEIRNKTTKGKLSKTPNTSSVQVLNTPSAPSKEMEAKLVDHEEKLKSAKQSKLQEECSGNCLTAQTGLESSIAQLTSLIQLLTTTIAASQLTSPPQTPSSKLSPTTQKKPQGMSSLQAQPTQKQSQLVSECTLSTIDEPRKDLKSLMQLQSEGCRRDMLSNLLRPGVQCIKITGETIEPCQDSKGSEPSSLKTTTDAMC
ncbi:hypothetical protein [Beihai sobemo-like virus 15]|uniref:hypothetical protein n=1 Tax=Beihai sobemo-like virus 15 TaxID=1922686 RepID=UPI00090953EF|nr:hypothetical protein [Beihai sobemo-like virus 15]APG75656.1 hypothetical protein [Beihai sobemo-like virus 15]